MNPWAWLMLIAWVGVPLVVRTIAPREGSGPPFHGQTTHLKKILS